MLTLNSDETMKNIEKILLSAAIAALTSCSLEEYPLNGPSTGTYPSSEQETRAGVLGAYKSIAASVNSKEPIPIRYMDQITDIGCARRSLYHYEEFKTSVQTPEHTVVEYLYKRIYVVAGRVHMVLDNLDKLYNNGTLTLEQYSQYKAELLLIRAYVYDLGCQVYGDIPFIDHSLSLTDYKYPRTKRSEVTARLMTDLDDELLDYLPISWNRSEWGTARIGRAAAYALKARIALNWEMFEEAARCSKKAIELSDGVYSLTPLNTTYYATAADGEPDPSPLFGFEGEKTSTEWMWALQYNILAISNTHSGIYEMSPRIQNGSAGIGTTQSMMDSFQCTDGLPITQSPLYDWQNPWKNRDPRLDLYTVRPNSRTMGIECTTDKRKTTVKDYILDSYVVNSDVSGNKSEYGINGVKGCGGYLWRKYYDKSYHGQITGAKYEDELDVPVIRYAELLLIDAEANIEWESGDLSRAAQMINQVRARVDMPEVTATDRKSLRSALRYERKVELCAEGFRWFDLRRWQTLDSKRMVDCTLCATALNGEQYAPAFATDENPLPLSNAVPTIDENWIVTYDGTTWDGNLSNLRVHITLAFKDRDKVWPIPYTEMITNDLMTQNEGY